MNAVTISRAGLADLDDLVPLFDGYRQFYQQVSDVEGARAFLGERLTWGQSVVFLASRDGCACGFTQLFPSFTSGGMAPIYILNDLFVATQARGIGAGRALLKAAADWAFAQGAVRLTLSTAHDNVTAQRLYEACGWAHDNVFRTYTLRCGG